MSDAPSISSTGIDGTSKIRADDKPASTVDLASTFALYENFSFSRAQSKSAVVAQIIFTRDLQPQSYNERLEKNLSTKPVEILIKSDSLLLES